MGCIYVATNCDNGKKYVGQTLDFSRRLRQHNRNADNLYFENAIQKYGSDNFEFLTMEYPNDTLNYWETFWIEKNNTMVPNGYNLKTGGGSCRLSEETKNKIGNALRGKKKSIEHCENLRKSHIGKTIPLEQRIKMSLSHIGIVHSPEHCKKLSEAHKGKVMSNEARKSISIAQTGRKHSEETKRKMSEAHLKRKQHEPQVGRSQIAGY